MIFKRKEGFRFTFGEAIEAKFSVVDDAQAVNGEKLLYDCQILDVSPKGMKMFSSEEIGEHNTKLLHLEVNFILYTTAIQVVGEVVWVKEYGNGVQYGLEFKEQPNIENLIIEELKMRRRREVLQKQ